MSQKIILYFISSWIILALNSCSNNKTNPLATSTDSSSTAIPADLQELNAKLQSEPNNAELYFARANYYLKAQKFQEGLSDAIAAVSIDSSKAPYYITLSDLYFVTNKTSNTKAALEKCLKLDDKNVEAMLKLAELYLYVRKHEESMKYINMALKQDQYNAKAYFMKGMNYKELKDTAKAISSMQTAVEQDQQYYLAYMQLGLLCAATHNPLAAQYYKNASKISPTSQEAWYSLGKYYQDEMAFENALEAYNTLIRIDPKYINAYYNMGAIYLIHQKKYDAAINSFTTAITLSPKYVQAYYSRGVSYQTKGDVKKAKADFQACIDLDPRFEPAHDALKALK